MFWGQFCPRELVLDVAPGCLDQAGESEPPAERAGEAERFDESALDRLGSHAEADHDSYLFGGVVHSIRVPGSSGSGVGEPPWVSTSATGAGSL
jgi:hypothetical protein